MMRYKSVYPLGTFLIKQKTTKKQNQATNENQLMRMIHDVFLSYVTNNAGKNIVYNNSIRMDEIHNIKFRFTLF